MSKSTRHYLINMTDGRVILYTKQAANQINYYPISEAAANAISSGKISKTEVIAKIKAHLLDNQDAWDDLLKKKTAMNVRKSTLTPEDTEGAETAPKAEDVDEEFDIPDESAGGKKKDAPADKGGKSSGGRGGKKKDAPADKGEDAAPENGEEMPAGDANEDLGDI